MKINPFITSGGTVPAGSKPRQLDTANMILYNEIMRRYYHVGTDYKNGVITKSQAKFHLGDIVDQLNIMRSSELEPNVRRLVENALNRVTNALTHIDDATFTL